MQSDFLQVEIKCKAEDGANLPLYKTLGASGADIFAFLKNDVTIKSGQISLIPTGLRFEIPSGFEIQVRSRSGLAAEFGVMCLNSPGTIDSDFRGEVKVILANFGKNDFVVKNGTRIAQLVVAQSIRANFKLAKKISSTERGEAGFGSTGF